jgi:Zn-dependent M28 family amino/carboxypeptidase
MLELPDRIVGEAYRSRQLWETLVSFASIDHRVAGHKGEATAASVLEDYFSYHSNEVTTSRFPVPKWSGNEVSLTVLSAGDGDARISTPEGDVRALSGSPSGDVTAELVSVRNAHPDEYHTFDLDGTIVMASSDNPQSSDRWVHRMEKYTSAVDCGADGFLFRNRVDGRLPAAGDIGYENRPAPIPAVGVSAELGIRLRRYYGDRPQVRLRTDCETEPATSRNVEAVVGPETQDAVVVTAHLDSHPHGEGAADNAAGCALLVEIARLLSKIQDSLETQLRFVGFGAEEVGLYGSTAWAAEQDLSEVKCLVNLDGTTGSDTLHVGLNSFTALKSPFEETANALYAPLSTDSSVIPHGDQWAVVKEGVPVRSDGTRMGTYGGRHDGQDRHP